MVSPRSVVASLRQTVQDAPLLGVMVWTGGLRPEYVRDTIAELSSLDVPIAVLADEASSVRPRHTGIRGRLRQFQSGTNEAAGATVARHLLALGHRRIGYLSLNHRSSWSRERLRGLRTAFGAAGLIDAVVPLTQDTPARPDRLSVLPRTARPLLASLPGLLDTQPNPPFTSEHDLDTLLAAMRTINRRWWLRRDLEPLVARALAERRLSAWVAATDEVAMECLEALRRHRIDVPGEISLVGFDDSLGALDTMLTSYNFNAQAIVDAMLRHVLNPQWQALRRFGDRPVEIEGFLSERTTTGEAA
jgi:DNA-binding LacI/PurR family transcriptional regulator